MDHEACDSGGGRRSRPRTRGHKAAKRATFPYINSQIISVAETGDLHRLMAAIEEFMPSMNLVNICTALHRLAKLTANDTQAQQALQRSHVVPALVLTARGALAKSEVGGAPPQCQALSNIVWSMATIGCVDLPLLEIAANLSWRHIGNFKPFELSATLWGFAKMDSISKQACECAALLFTAASDHIARHVEDYTFRCLVMIAWAFAAARQHHEVLFRGIAQPMLSMVHTAQCQEISNAAWAFSMAGFRDDKLFSELSRKALRQLSDFKPQELSNMLWGFAVVGYFREDFFVSAAVVAQSIDLQAQQLATILWALSKLRPHHRSTCSAVLALVPRCTRNIGAFTPEELSSVALAAAKAFGKSRSDAQAIGVVKETAPPAWKDPWQDSAGAGAKLHAPYSGLPPVIGEFFATMLPLVVTRLREFSGQALANIATASLALHIGLGSDFYHALGRELLLRVRELETTSLCLLLRNLPAAPQNACGHAVRALFREAATRVPWLDAKQLQVLSRICGSLLGQNRNRQMQPQELRDVCLALSEASAWPVKIPQCIVQEDLDDEESHDDGDAPNHEQQGWSELPTGTNRPDPRQAALPALNYSVKNTFIDVDGDEAGSGEEDDKALISLPPPLDIVPSSVSAEKLEAYRYDYQNFRVGNATGAKGEVAEVTLHNAEASRSLAGLDLATAAYPRVKAIEEEESTASSPKASQPPEEALPLPPALDFMPRFIDVQQLEAYRSTYRSFRQGHASGAKGEISKVVVPDPQPMPPRDRAPFKALPPPLGILPSVVSPEELANFRVDYQNFRAGKAVGAKGEVSAIKEATR